MGLLQRGRLPGGITSSRHQRLPAPGASPDATKSGEKAIKTADSHPLGLAQRKRSGSLLDVVHRAPVLVAALQWGDVPSWLSAGVTLAALVFAVVAVVVARRTYRLESGRDLVNAEARQQQDLFVRRSQAALVSAWWAKEDGHQDRPRDPSWAVHLRNASDAPVYKAHLTVMGMGEHARRKALELSVVPPTQAPTIHAVKIPTARGDRERDSLGHPLSEYRVSLRFTDSAGVRWIRDEYGSLRELERDLLIWTSPEGAAVVKPFTAEFLATYGVTAECDPKLIEGELKSRFTDTKQGPDILIGPHDWVGGLAQRGLVDPITLSDERRSSFAPEYLNAFSFEGAIYAVPSSLDTVALIRNTDLAPDEPESIEQLLAVAKALRDKGTVTELMTVPVGFLGNPFHVWPIFTSAGGWLFERRPDGSWDPSQQGITAPETLRAFDKIRMLAELGVLQREINRVRSIELFRKGQTAFILAASGAVVPARASGVNFAVSSVPPFQDGSPSTPFLSVNGFYVASRGRNKIVAVDLVPDYLTRSDVTESFGRLAHVVPVRLTEDCDPAVAAFHALCARAMPMPSFPQIGDVLGLMGAAELRLIAGEDAAVVADDLAERVGLLF
jgi:arabinogalactan oligomer / maltooligosaccharide transport system substrate-binding protein